MNRKILNYFWLSIKDKDKGEQVEDEAKARDNNEKSNFQFNSIIDHNEVTTSMLPKNEKLKTKSPKAKSANTCACSVNTNTQITTPTSKSLSPSNLKENHHHHHYYYHHYYHHNNTNNNNGNNSKQDDQQQQQQQSTLNRRLNESLEMFTKNLKSYLKRQQIHHVNKNLQNEWKLIALIVDRLLFWIFTFITLVSSIVLLVVVPLMKNKINDFYYD